MTLDYYLVDRKFGRIFDVGCHRHVYPLALRVALAMRGPPALGWFCLACASHALAWQARFPESYASDYLGWGVFDVVRHAANIHDFCEQASWDVELVNDCDDSLSPYDGLPTTHTVYTLSHPAPEDG